jgi:hypothetical protein
MRDGSTHAPDAHAARMAKLHEQLAHLWTERALTL